MSNQVATKPLMAVGFWTIFAIVLLRVAVGWHFFSEGLEKLEPGFSSAGLLRAAKGPMAPLYQDFLPNNYGYQDRLAVARESYVLTEDERQKQSAWASEYKKQIDAAKKAKEIPLADFPPFTPYTKWAEAIRAGWDQHRDNALAVLGPDEKTIAAVDRVYRTRLQQLADYLASEETAIDEYRHELWRLESLESSPKAEGVPFQEDRITDKSAEVTRTGQKWPREVQSLEATYLEDLQALAENEATEQKLEEKLHPPTRLDFINKVVTYVVLGVGGCLLLGGFTRCACVVGMLFLLSVIASQPPWVPGANTDYLGYQLAEVGAFMVLAAVGAGQWWGLDAVLSRFLPDCCTSDSPQVVEIEE